MRKRWADSELAEVTEYGVRFMTGTPVTFRYVRNTEASPNFGNRFQQDIEPAGRFMLHNPSPGDLARGWEAGEISFNSPLVLPLSGDMGLIYGPSSWKAALHRHYGKTGKALSRAIVKDGYDAVVTVASYGGKPVDTREIVDLTMFK